MRRSLQFVLSPACSSAGRLSGNHRPSRRVDTTGSTSARSFGTSVIHMMDVGAVVAAADQDVVGPYHDGSHQGHDGHPE